MTAVRPRRLASFVGRRLASLPFCSHLERSRCVEGVGMSDVLRIASCAVAMLFALGADGRAHQPPPLSPSASLCAGSEFREFDFWLGAWRIKQRILRADGAWLELPARTHVSASPDGCALVEHWAGEVQFFWEGMERPEPIWGLSVRRYDPAQRTWSIYWMDRRSPEFGTPYVGKFDGARGEFFRTMETKNGQRKARIAFTRINGDRVDWDLAISADNGVTWTVLWRMEMSRQN